MRSFGNAPSVMCLLMGVALLSPTHAVAAQTPVTARVVGQVYDSIAAAPLPNALVRLFRPDDPSVGINALTDERGLFDVPDVPGGVWVASFAHARLDSLRLEAPLARVAIVESGTIPLILAIASASSVARMLCPSGSDSAVTLVGEVRSVGDKSPVAGATVSVEWPEWVFAKKSTVREEVRRTARTDREGRYVLCGAARGTVVTARAWQTSDSTGQIEFDMPESAYAVLDLFVDRRASAAMLPTDSGAPAPASARAGAVVVRGTVQSGPAGALPDATVRVIGSGAAVRTDSTGAFYIVDAAGGTQSVEARAIGYEPERRAVQLEPGVPLELSFRLNKRSVLLDTVRVVVGQSLPNDVRSLERRWRQGQGMFLDGATVRERTSTMVTNALTGLPGIRVVSGQGWGNNIVGRNFVGLECRATLFLDGYLLSSPGRYPATLDEMVLPDEVAVLEVYGRSSTVPAEYLTIDGCGVVAVWTKRGLGNVPVFGPPKQR
jgi:hypothetical protein